MSSQFAISTMSDAPTVSSIPYYLTPNEALPTSQPGVIDLFNYDLPSNQYVEPTSSVWSEIGDNIGDSVDKAGDYVWSAADGVWKSTKDVLSGVGDLAKEGYSFVWSQFLMFVGVLLLVVWVVSKSGILKQIKINV